ncbi:MAG: hypothetical protein MK226_06895 [Saprospiraceae bacterium]|nr:hypothetical protein [Saprospiraceae bacterium]
MKTLLQFLLLFIFISSSIMANAQTATWTGLGNKSDWDDEQNWTFTEDGSLSNPSTVFIITTATPVGPSTANQTTLRVKQLIIESGVTVINPMNFSIRIKGSRMNGLDNFGIFNNNGTIYIDQTLNEGLAVRCIGSFINNGTINIGQEVGMIGNNGLVTSGVFTNNAVINIDNVCANGLRNINLTTNFTNLGDIYIGQKDGNIQGYGWLIQGQFDNQYGIIAMNSMSNESIFVQANNIATK